MHSPAFGRARDGCSPIKLSPSFFLPLKQENTAQTWNTSKFVKKKKKNSLCEYNFAFFVLDLFMGASGGRTGICITLRRTIKTRTQQCSPLR